MGRVIAKVFMSGRSQAVRLPKDFRFSTDEVYVERETDRLVLTPKPRRFASKREMEEWLRSIHCPEFELERPGNGAPQKRDLF